ncbi:30S ribosomal protein S1 [bacterium]|nr:30S ribosomal protein S1 [bacterium]
MFFRSCQEQKNKIDYVHMKKIKSKKENKSGMSELLQSSKKYFQVPNIGDLLEGTIVSIEPGYVLVDLGRFGMGAIYACDFQNLPEKNKKIKIGKKISGLVREIENDESYIELSLDMASSKEIWQDLKSQQDKGEILKVKILDANKGGLIAEIRDIFAFLPVSQLSAQNYPRVDQGSKSKILEELRKLIDQDLEIKIIDVNQREDKLIISERAANLDQEKELLSQIKVGQVVKGEVSGVANFGAFVRFYPQDNKERFIEGLVHISELAWQRIDDPRNIVNPGDKVDAKIIDIDRDKVSLSIKGLEQDPWQKAGKKYEKGDKIKGEVTKIDKFGAFVQLDKDIHGLAHVAQFTGDMNEQIELGKKYKFEIISIEPEAHRLGLRLCKK